MAMQPLDPAGARPLGWSRHCRRCDWALTRYLLDDPVPWALERLGVLH